MGRCADVALSGQRAEEADDIPLAQMGRVTPVVKEDEPADPAGGPGTGRPDGATTANGRAEA